MNKKHLSFFAFVFLQLQVVALMTIQVTATPQLTPMLDDIYIAGSMNTWNPADENFKLIQAGNTWNIGVNGTNGDSITFKFTRGGIDWTTVEGSNIGAYINNRSAVFQDNTTLTCIIEGWEDLAGIHSVTANVRILDMDFAAPQLNRTRRIWILLPDGYDETDALYPVLYMHDGQNLFDQATGFFGQEWHVDETLLNEVLGCTDAIIVGIDNSEHRLDEYSPWVNTEYNEGGEGVLYAQFIAETLKPFIDDNFSTLSDRQHTATAGSSLGALISMYIAAAHNDVFAKAILFSPAFWFNTGIYTYVQNNPLAADSKLYFVCGDAESTGMVPDMQQMYDLVLAGNMEESNTGYVVQQGGQHSEYYWSQQFPSAYEFIFDCNSAIAKQGPPDHLLAYPNPARDSITLPPHELKLYKVQIIGSTGSVVYDDHRPADNTIDVRKLAAGRYVLQCFYDDSSGHISSESSTFIKE